MSGNLAKQQEQQTKLQREFERKNQILRSRFQELSPYEYLTSIFPDKSERDELVVVVGSRKDNEGNVIERGTITRVGFENVWDLAWRSNAYIPYCDFRRNYYHTRTLYRVRAFVCDCDGVTSARLNKILRYLWNSLPAEPTYIVNSGKGFHFVYALFEPVEVKGLRWSVNRLNETIQNTFSEILAVDRHPVVHPYRFPGFMTKINTTATGFKVREPYTLEELMDLFKIPSRKHRTRQKERKNVEKQAKIYVLPNGKRAFFEWVLRRLFKNPPIPGRRHNSFFALGIIAYKCRREVPEWEAVEAVDMVYDDMERYNLHIGFTREEAHSAFRKGYNPKAVRVRWKYFVSYWAGNTDRIRGTAGPERSMSN